MRLGYLIISIIYFFTIFIILPSPKSALMEKQSIIIEVDGDPKKHEQYLGVYHPFVEVVAVYDQLFNGLALRASTNNLTKVVGLEFIKNVHPVQTYEVLPVVERVHSKKNVTSPSAKYSYIETPEISLDQTHENFIDRKKTTKLLKQDTLTVLPSDLNNSSFTGKGVKVGVIDTGIDYTHPDLAKNYTGGYDLVDLDDDPMETTIEEGMATLHGTHVAGIIAGDGDMKGVAPDAEIYAYRALGPGGFGTSIHVIAALEQAVRDEVDVINLSLGNSVNGPDYPTSTAVNRAVDLGVAVVIASGNSGPDEWTVGSPATASKAIAVGALASPQRIPFLYDRQSNREIPLLSMVGSVSWDLDKDYQVVQSDDEQINVRGKIALIKRDDTSFYELAKWAEAAGAVAVIIFDDEAEEFQGSIQAEEDPVTIPVATVSQKEVKWLIKQIESAHFFIDTIYKKTKVDIAPFSSRGPVTVNWDLKPDVLAPGTNILSTVPNGYLELQGTSMAAPHVAGAIALIKEARPNWTIEQITSALKTSAIQIETEAGAILPVVQGMGLIDVERAINTTTIISDPLLTFGKMDEYKSTKQIELAIENTSNKEQVFHFQIPLKKIGIDWHLPQSFTVKPGETRKVKLGLAVTSMLIEEGIQQGWLTLNQEDHSYELPYLFINKTADFPKVMGFDLSREVFDEAVYTYQFYLPDEVESVAIHLYDPMTLFHEQKLLHLTNLSIGLNEGQIDKREFKREGNYIVILSVQMKDGSFESFESEIFVE